jgi:CheY-like chemotaxis protein
VQQHLTWSPGLWHEICYGDDKIDAGPRRAPSFDDQGSAHARRCIVVVEDDPAIAAVVEETLTAEAYEVVRTGAGRALRLARELRPDVVVPDNAMPDMDGAELILRLRADPTTAAIPIILMSACPPARTAAANVRGR